MCPHPPSSNLSIRLSGKLQSINLLVPSVRRLFQSGSKFICLSNLSVIFVPCALFLIYLSRFSIFIYNHGWCARPYYLSFQKNTSVLNFRYQLSDCFFVSLSVCLFVCFVLGSWCLGMVVESKAHIPLSKICI